MGYNPQEYWSRVAREIANRPGQKVVAGDDTPFYRYQRETFLRRFLSSINVAGKAVFEVGCGPGGNLRELLKEKPRRLVGCDISPSMVDLAKRNSGVECFLTDGTTLPFQDREFDVVFTVTVLQHNPTTEMTALLRDMCRVVKERIYLFEHTSQATSEAYSMFTRRPSDYIGVCEQEGFRCEEVGYLNVAVSERICNTLMGRLNRRGRKEGEPVTTVSVLAERTALPITKMIDGFVRRDYGLTKMAFGRRL